MARIEFSFPGDSHPEFLAPSLLESAKLQAPEGVESVKLGDIIPKQFPHTYAGKSHDGTVKVVEIDPSGNFAGAVCIVEGCPTTTIVHVVL